MVLWDFYCKEDITPIKKVSPYAVVIDVQSASLDGLNICSLRNIISSEHLEEALRVHWKRGVILGEVLKELRFIEEEQLREVLESQGNALI